MSNPATDRVRLRRLPDRGSYDRAAILGVLDAGMIAHVGVDTDQGPVVLPMAYGRTDDDLYLHGSVANAALRAGVGRDVCVTVTIVDAIVVGRTPFHNSMNYRSVVVRGTARQVDDPAELLARAASGQRPCRADLGDGPPADPERAPSDAGPRGA